MRVFNLLKGLPVLLFLTSCNEKGGRHLTSSLKDSVRVDVSKYPRLLEEYKKEPLINDTILLGFRIGMPLVEAKARITDLLRQNVLIENDENIFYLIPVDEWCSEDKDSVHQFVTKLSFSFKDNRLTRIYVKLFAPRFYITPIRFRRSEEEMSNDPIYQEYRKIVGDSFYYASRAEMNDPKFYKGELQLLFDDQLLSLFEIKYGPARHILLPNEKSLVHEITRIWIDKGRLIKLSLDTGYSRIAEQYLSRNVPVSKADYSHLIPIGGLLYSSIPSEIHFYQAVDMISKELGKQLDSIMRSNEDDRELREKVKVDKIGI
ncbi:MAG: hypothetical protein J0I32_07990 [Sphingobacteriales bacterium]|nr:hypothetical protein [Sphingobacteriales bacterium]OJW03526.1 MAG: hypothetical protein BGO52_15140 [Sphingobacteriales bacterium 44-61]